MAKLTSVMYSDTQVRLLAREIGPLSPM